MSLSTLDPRTALVVIDLQQGIVAMPTQPYSGAEVVARTAELAAAFRAQELPVVLVRVSFAADFADAVPGRTERQARGLAFPEGWGRRRRRAVRPRRRHPRHQAQLERLPRHRPRRPAAPPRHHPDRADRRRHQHRRGVHRPRRLRPRLPRHAGHRRHGRRRTPEAHRGSVERIFPRLGESGATAEVLELLAKTHG